MRIRTSDTPGLVVRLASLLLAAPCLAACGAGGDAEITLVRDSAGVRIVESSAPAWADDERWRVVEPPLVEIGTDQGDDAYQLFDVRGAVRLSDGRIVVLNAGTNELRWYDATGRHQASAGGTGGGPGEFSSLDFIALLPGDSVLAFNLAPARASLFAPDGMFVRDLPVPLPDDRMAWIGLVASGVLTGKRLVFWSQPLYGSGYNDFRDGINRLPHPIGIADLEHARFDSVGLAPGWDVWVEHQGRGDARMAAPPFARSSDVIGSGDQIYIAPTDDFTVMVLDASGALTRIVRTPHEPVPIRSRDWDAWVAELVELFPMPPEQRAEGNRLLAAMPVPDDLPAYRGLDVDRAGNLWLHDYPRPGLASPGARVFDSTGRWLGSVSLPAGIKRALSREPLPFDIGADWILGIWTDAQGVERVRLYRLDKPSG